MSHGFPNQFYTGFIQGGVTASTTAMFEQQAEHIAYIITETLARGATTVEPTLDAQDELVQRPSRRARSTTPTSSGSARPATTTTRASGEGIRSHLGDPYAAGFYVFEDLLQAWRNKGDLDGLVLEIGVRGSRHWARGGKSRQVLPLCPPLSDNVAHGGTRSPKVTAGWDIWRTAATALLSMRATLSLRGGQPVHYRWRGPACPT